jgi:hypothetical protein
MEISIEYDPNFGEGSEDDLTPDWQKLALDNTNDDPKLRNRHGFPQIVDYQDLIRILLPVSTARLLSTW